MRPGTHPPKTKPLKRDEVDYLAVPGSAPCNIRVSSLAMPISLPAFDADKALEVLAYTASRANTDLYCTLKLIYLADKLHLERYGRFIFGDWYAALEFGPVPSHSYDIMKHARGDRPMSLASHAPDVLRVDAKTNSIEVLREPDLEELSESDIECLDEAIRTYSKYGFERLKRETHDAAYDATSRNREMALEAIASTTSRAAELIQHLSDPHPDRR